MSKETFVWDDELVKEYAAHLIVGKGEGITDPNKHLQAFKQSKMPKKDKDYEVIEIENKVGGKIRKTRDDKSWFEVFNLKNFDGFKINAVKRLSSNETFTVGETVGCILNNTDFKVERIDVHTGECYLMATGHLLPLLNAKKLPPQSKPEQPKKERIEITQYSNINIPEEKFPAIKAALERVLNDDKDELLYDGMASFLRGLKYSEEELREAEEKAFNAARQRNRDFPLPGYLRFQNFPDYLNHKSKQ